MLTPLGFWGGAASGDFELIATIYGTGASSTVSFTSIPQTYKHLQLRASVKTIGDGSGLNGSFNAGTALCSAHYMYGGGTTATAGGAWGQTAFQLTPTGLPYYFESYGTALIISDILNYSDTNKNKIIKTLYGVANGSAKVSMVSGNVNSTDAVTSFNISATYNFETISRFSLYGIKG